MNWNSEALKFTVCSIILITDTDKGTENEWTKMDERINEWKWLNKIALLNMKESMKQNKWMVENNWMIKNKWMTGRMNERLNKWMNKLHYWIWMNERQADLGQANEYKDRV